MAEKIRHFGVQQLKKPVAVRVGRFKVKWLPDSNAKLSAWVLVCYVMDNQAWRLLPGCELVTSLAASVPVSELVTRGLQIVLVLEGVCGEDSTGATVLPWYVGGVRYLTEAEPLPPNIEKFASEYLSKLEKQR